jgi:hypothetical protein
MLRFCFGFGDVFLDRLIGWSTIAMLINSVLQIRHLRHSGCKLCRSYVTTLHVFGVTYQASGKLLLVA